MGTERPARRERPPLRRSSEGAVLAGVCAGFARSLGVDPILIRVGLVVAAAATAGVAIVGYLLAWILMAPDADDRSGRAESRVTDVIARLPLGNWRVATGVGFLTLATLLSLREVGLWWSDALAWPLILAASGAALLWSQSRAMQPEPESAAAPAEALRAAPRRPPRRAGLVDVYRGGFGVAFVLGAALIVLSTTGALDAASDALITALVVVLALGLILAPFLWRLGRNLTAERAERIRSQERAEMAAHLHDSVLQTLALVQTRADDPRTVAQLARRQERELRSWLYEADRAGGEDSLAATLRGVAAAVENAHGVPVEVVVVGDSWRGERAEALVAAAREAIVNAAKFAPDAGSVDVYGEVDAGRATVFVRDRGQGFDLDAIPRDRRGVRDSIIGRMERFGGTAEIRSAPGAGTEVELRIETDTEPER